MSLLFSSLLSLIIGTVVGLTQSRIKRLFAFSTIVRRCALFIHGIEDSMHCSQMHPASELGGGESPKPNLAFPLKWLTRLIQTNRLVVRAVFSMIRAILLKVYLQGSSTKRNYLGWYRVGKSSEILIWCISL